MRTGAGGKTVLGVLTPSLRTAARGVGQTPDEAVADLPEAVTLVLEEIGLPSVLTIVQDVARCHRFRWFPVTGHQGARAGRLRLIRVIGSHHMLRSPEGRFTVVPVHRGVDIEPGTLRRIIRDGGPSVAEFVQLPD